MDMLVFVERKDEIHVACGPVSQIYIILELRLIVCILSLVFTATASYGVQAASCDVRRASNGMPHMV